MAINSMSLIYANAAPTLVLDAELRRLPASADPATLMAYVNFCGWTTRAWTLQEGSLSEALIFALSDGFFDPKSQKAYAIKESAASNGDRQTSLHKRSFSERLLSRWMQPHDAEEGASGRHRNKHLRKHLFSYWSEIRPSIWPNIDEERSKWEGEAMRLVWNGLIRRDTTEERDLPLILANLLGFRALDILQSDRPVATIIGSLRNISVGLLYNTGGRLRPVPASGAPASQSGSQPIAPEYSDFEFLNRWVPAEIRGTSIPEGPVFLAFGSTLRMHNPRSSESSESTARIFTTYMITMMPPRCVLKHARDPAKLFIVKADSQPGDDMVNERLKTVTKGICFIMEAAVDDLRQNRSVTRGAALAIVDESPEQLTTIFHSAIRVEIGNAQQYRRYKRSTSDPRELLWPQGTSRCCIVSIPTNI